jgi:hypothetical protein
MLSFSDVDQLHRDTIFIRRMFAYQYFFALSDLRTSPIKLNILTKSPLPGSDV